MRNLFFTRSRSSKFHVRVMFFLFVFLGYSLAGYSQEQQEEIKTDTTKKSEVKEDTTRIVVGKKEIQIIENPTNDDKEVHIKDKKDSDNDDGKGEKRNKRSGGFKGHWSGVEIGLNNYLNKDDKMTLDGGDEFMSLNTNRSINVNVNIVQHSFGIIGNQFGLTTGLGFEFYNYFFENNNSIDKDDQGMIVTVPYEPITLEKSKLTMYYLTAPLLFELQFPGHLTNKHRIRVAVGVLGGLKINSHTKVVYYENSQKQKRKNHDDFNINSLRYGFTARIGYKHINLYANYYPVTLFEKNKGPILYPISVGIAFVGK